MSTIGLTDSDWDTLLRSIDEKDCTPFIGAGACEGTVPLASELALRWADEFEFPLSDSTNLGQVAQFIAIERGGIFPKKLFRWLLQDTESPDFSEPSEPHGALADLRLPIYITTNYDRFMFEALQSRGVSPSRRVCGWNELIRERPSAIVDDAPKPTNPLVYHLHGHCKEPHSMVLTEDDYLEFLVRLSKDGSERLLPPVVRAALAETSLLFVGYSLADWDFRVLFRGLIGSLGATLGSMSIAVQLDPPARHPSEHWLVRAQEYVQDYFKEIQKLSVRVYWGDARKFSCELSERWKAFGGDGR